MFGYVVLNREELKLKDYELYRSYYCGLCRELRDRYGLPGQLSLTYDMTFVILLLTGLYEPPVQKGKTRCIVQPVRRHTVRRNRFTGYAADLNVILTYYKCQDDWQDEHSPLRLAYAKLLEAKLAQHAAADDDWAKRAKELLAVPRDVMDTMENYTGDPAAVYRWRDAMADLLESPRPL